MAENHDPIRSSRRLSKILRHRLDIPHDSEGWFLMDDVIRYSGMTREKIEGIVIGNTRYQISEDGTRIRAFHGHSISVEYGNAVEPPPVLYHGTSVTAYNEIQHSGAILPMRREMVHLTESKEYAMDVAKRRGGNDIVILEIDSERMSEDGIIFHLSGDGVYLVDSVPTEYIRLIDLNSDSEL